MVSYLLNSLVPTNTPEPSATPTETPTATNTPTRTPSPTATNTATATTRYLQGLDVVAQNDGTKIRYFQYDALGSVRQLSDSTGAISLSQTFDPYGNGFSKSGAGTTKLGFTGEATDSNGFVFLRARYYQPGMGRFLNTDPSRREENSYLYSYSNPVNYADPSGYNTEGQIAEITLYSTYGISLLPSQYSVFSDDEKKLILETVEDYANFLGGTERFRHNVDLKYVQSTWANPDYLYASYDHVGTITLPPMWFKAVITTYPDGKTLIALSPPCLSDFGFPADAVPSLREGAKFIFAHEMSHALERGNPETYDSFIKAVPLPWPIFAFLNPNPLIAQRLNRGPEELFADVIAADLYSPGLLNEDMKNWLENKLPGKLWD